MHKRIINIILGMLLLFTVLSIPSEAAEEVIIIANEDCCPDFEYEPNFRTMVVVDVITHSNTHELQHSDYRPKLEVDIFKEQEFWKQADLQEYIGFKGDFNTRENVLISGDEYADYAYKLDKLINNNIMSRESKYYLDAEIGASFITIEPRSDATTYIQDYDNKGTIKRSR